MEIVKDLTTNISPDMPLRSILRASKAEPHAKLRAVVALLRGQQIQEFAHDLAVTKEHLSRATGAVQYKKLKRQAAEALGLRVEDIWPTDKAAA